MYTLDLSYAFSGCHLFINTIEDYKIDVVGETIYTEDVIRKIITEENIKILLLERLLHFEDDAKQGILQLMKSLKKTRSQWRNYQYATISQLNDIIARKTGEEKKKYEGDVHKYLTFFHHMYTIIDVLLAKITNTILDNHTQFKIQKIGLVWNDELKRIEDSTSDHQSKNQLSLDEPVLRVLHDTKSALYAALKPMVDVHQHLQLRSLIEGESLPTEPIIIRSQVKKFGEAFFKAKAIDSGQCKLFSEELPKYFIRDTGKGMASFKPSILVKYLRGDELRGRSQ